MKSILRKLGVAGVFVCSLSVAKAEVVDITGDVSMGNQLPADGVEILSEIVLLDISEDAPAEVLQGQTFRGNNLRNGNYLTSGVPAFSEVKWKFKTGEEVRSSPVMVDGVVYVGSLDNKFYAIDAETGEEKWSFTTKGDIYSSPTVYKGVVFFASIDGFLYALNTEDGSLVWKTQGKGQRPHSKNTWADKVIADAAPDIVCSPAIAYGVVFISTTSKIHGFDIKTGKQVYRNPCSTTTRALGTIAISQGKYFARSTDVSSGGYTIRSGVKTVKGQDCGNDARNNTPLIWEDTFYHTGILGLIYGRNIKTKEGIELSLCGATAGRLESGNKNSAFPEFRSLIASPATNGKMIIVPMNNGISGSDLTSKGFSYSKKKSWLKSKEKWFFKTGARIKSSPSIAKEIVYIGDDNGVFRALDINTGDEMEL